MKNPHNEKIISILVKLTGTPDSAVQEVFSASCKNLP